ncbi:MAG: hemin-degrading factor, partial [Reyranella sp.]
MLATPNAELAARWSRLRGEKPALRIRDAAATLGVSEAELVALGVGTTAT